MVTKRNGKDTGHPIKTAHNKGFAKVAVQYSADSFVVDESFVFRINISGENRHLRQAPKRLAILKRKNKTIDDIIY